MITPLNQIDVLSDTHYHQGTHRATRTSQDMRSVNACRNKGFLKIEKETNNLTLTILGRMILTAYENSGYKRD